MAKLLPELAFDADRTMSRLGGTVVDDGLSIGQCNATGMGFRGTGLIQRLGSVGPFDGRFTGDGKLVGQLVVADLARGIALVELLSACGRQGRVAVKFH